MTYSIDTARLRTRRSAKAGVDPWRPLAVRVEEERAADRRKCLTLTVFLVGSECPFTCLFCDLWRYTLDEPTPAGALPRQLQLALGSLEAGERPTVIKLYNASNFFESRAVPRADLEAIAEHVREFERVVVECHPKLIDAECGRFAARLAGRLEVAMGLETIHPRVLPRLNKQMTVDDFDRAVDRLRGEGIDVRAFVLVGLPFLSRKQAVEWAVRSCQHAWRRGVGVVSLIPVRSGAGEMRRLRASGCWQSPTLRDFEAAVEQSAASGEGVLCADLWDVDELESCADCRAARVERLRRLNLDGELSAPVACGRCRSGAGA